MSSKTMFQQIATLNRTVGKEMDSFRFCINYVSHHSNQMPDKKQQGRKIYLRSTFEGRRSVVAGRCGQRLRGTVHRQEGVAAGVLSIVVDYSYLFT